MELQREQTQRQGRPVGEGTVRRARRSDYGSFRASERDTELLYLVGEQYALTLPQLARLIGRSPHTARALRDRWKRAGWIGSGKLAVQAPPFVWLSRRGARVAQSPYRAWQPNHGLALHIEAVTEVRLFLEGELHLGEWECERSIAQRFAEYRGLRSHLPDAILTTSDGEIAIEVELTLKNRGRLTEIARQTGGTYQRVWYFARPTLIPALQTIAAESAWQNIDIHPYPPTRGADKHAPGPDLRLTPG
jgi:DNA-binding CsgD family transcriptional regulator